MTATDLISVEVPDIGDFDGVPVIEIHVAPGDAVALDDPLLTLESDKATMDVPAPFPGVVRGLHVKVGDRVSQGTLLLEMEASEGSEGLSGGGSTAAAVASDGAPTEAAAPDAIASATDTEAQDPAGSGPAPSSSPERSSEQREPIYASPAVRRRARELGVDLTKIAGSGRKGRITKDDLEALSSSDGGGTGGSPSPSAPGLSLPAWPTVNFEKFGPVERVPRSRIQRIAAPNLARNWVMIPHVTHNDEADITALEAWRKELNAEQDVAKITMVSFLVIACVATLKEFPAFNSSLDGDELVVKHYYNIGFAADTPGGLVVPVIKNADRLGLLEIASELRRLSVLARDGKLGPGDMQGSTFTISSLGGIGGTAFTPIINAPEVAILGVTRAAMKPVWDAAAGAFEPRLMLPLSLSYDHRVIDGAAAARFVVHLGSVLSDLRRALL